MADTAAFALDFCERHGVDRAAAQRVRLVIEELFTNSIQHGYRGETDAPVRIELGLVEGHVTVQYEDSAPRYDPLAQLESLTARTVTSLEHATEGGLGIYLVGKSAYGADYRYEDGHNRLRLVMPRP